MRVKQQTVIDIEKYYLTKCANFPIQLNRITFQGQDAKFLHPVGTLSIYTYRVRTVKMFQRRYLCTDQSLCW